MYQYSILSTQYSTHTAGILMQLNLEITFAKSGIWFAYLSAKSGIWFAYPCGVRYGIPPQ